MRDLPGPAERSCLCPESARPRRIALVRPPLLVVEGCTLVCCVRHGDNVLPRLCLLPWRSGRAKPFVHQRAKAAQVDAAELRGLQNRLKRIVGTILRASVGLVAEYPHPAEERMRLVAVDLCVRICHNGARRYLRAVPLSVVYVAPALVHVVGKRLPRAGAVKVSVGREVRPGVVALHRDACGGHVVYPRRKVEALHHGAAYCGLVVHAVCKG